MTLDDLEGHSPNAGLITCNSANICATFSDSWTCCPGITKISDLKEIEKIQKRATKLVIKLKNKSCIDRLIYLNLPNLKYRRLRGDMTEVFKITHNIYDRAVSPDLPFKERANTRGNHYKLQNHIFHYDLRKHFFLHAL